MSSPARIPAQSFIPPAWENPSPSVTASSSREVLQASPVHTQSTPGRQSDRRKEKSVRSAAAAALAERRCRVQQEEIDRRINVLLEKDPNIETLAHIISTYQEAKTAYEEAIAIIKSVRGILSNPANQQLKASLSMFLTRRDNAQTAIDIHQALRHVLNALACEEDFASSADTNKRLSAIDSFTLAAHTLSRLTPEELEWPLDLCIESVTNGRDLLDYSLIHAIEHLVEHTNEKKDELQTIDDDLEEKENRLFTMVPDEEVQWPAEVRTFASEVLRDTFGLADLTKQSHALFNDAMKLAEIGARHFPEEKSYRLYINDAVMMIMNRSASIISHQQYGLDLSILMLRLATPTGIGDTPGLDQVHRLTKISENIKILDEQFAIVDRDVFKKILESGDPTPEMYAELHDVARHLPEVCEEACEQIRYQASVTRTEAAAHRELAQVADILDSVAAELFIVAQRAKFLVDATAAYSGPATHRDVSGIGQAMVASLKVLDWSMPVDLETEDVDAQVGSSKMQTAAAGPDISADTRRLRRAQSSSLDVSIDNERVQRSMEKLEAHIALSSEKSKTAVQNAEAMLTQLRNGNMETSNTWRNIKVYLEQALLHKKSEMHTVAKAIEKWRQIDRHPQSDRKIAALTKYGAMLNAEVGDLSRKMMRDTIEAIALRPTDAGVEYLKEHGRLKSVTQPTWVEHKDPDADFKHENDRRPSDFVHEYVFTAKADPEAPDRKFVLHAHYREANPPLDALPLKRHYKLFRQRHLGREWEARQEAGQAQKVYRSVAAYGIRIAREHLGDQAKWVALPQA